MRAILVAGVAGLFLAWGSVAQEERRKNEEPVKIIKVERKTPVLYDKDIEPILVNKCAFCHSGNVKESKLDLATYETMMKGGKRGAAVVPGNAEKSNLYMLCTKLRRPYMPPRSEKALSPKELALIKLWIDEGAKAPLGMRELPKVVLKVPSAVVVPVFGVAVSPDKSAVAASRGNQIHVYDAGSGTYVRSLIDPNLTSAGKKAVKGAHLSLVESLAYSPDGKYLASGSYQEVVLWDARTGMLRKRLTGFAERVVTLAFSNDGKLLATGGGAPSLEGELKIFDVASGKMLQNVQNSHSDTVLGVTFSPDDKMIASCGADKFVKVFNVADGKFLKSFEGHTHHVMAVGWSGDGKLLASGGADNVVKVWEYAKGEQIRTINAHTKQVTGLRFIAKTTNFVTVSGDGGVRFWNVNSANIGNFSAAPDFLYSVGLSADGNLVAVGGQEGVVRVFNRAGGPPKSLLPPSAERPAPKKK
jgi:WD40 repeat protein